jgi:methionyl-tRNA formyltransferase
MKPLRIVFAGTPAFGLPALDAIHHSAHAIVGVYTQPDRPAGRGQKLQPSAIKAWAVERVIPVYQPLNFKTENSREELKAIQADVMVVIAYGLILPQKVLDIPRLGCVNVHASLLPQWRGASPIQQSILHGNTDSGVSIMQMDKGMDTGAVYTDVSYCLQPEETAQSLHDTLAEIAVSPLLETLDALALGNAKARPQDTNLVSYAPKIKKKDAEISWQSSAVTIDCMVRAYTPWPVAYTVSEGIPLIRIYQGKVLDEKRENAVPAGTILSIDANGIQVACGTGVYLIERIQLAGKKPMMVSEWLKGHSKQLDPGMQLLSPSA